MYGFSSVPGFGPSATTVGVQEVMSSVLTAVLSYFITILLHYRVSLDTQTAVSFCSRVKKIGSWQEAEVGCET